jgi:di/tricarboxylate transporter
MTMDKTGLARIVAGHWAHYTQSVLPAAWAPYFLLAGVYVGTLLLTEVLSNNATIMLMGPLAIKLAEAVGLHPRPFMVAACIASSAGFMIPTGYQTHTYIYGVGGYRFKDFLRIGWPLDLGYAVMTLLIVPRVWPF